MKQLIAICAMVLGLGLISGEAKAYECIKLGWSGGSAKRGFKWVGGYVKRLRGRRYKIRYYYRKGVMYGTKRGGWYTGTWRQRGGAWGRFRLYIPRRGKVAYGWWSSRNSRRRHTLAVKACRR